MAIGYLLLAAGLLMNGTATTLAGDLLLLGRGQAIVAELAPEQIPSRLRRELGNRRHRRPTRRTQLLIHTGPFGLWSTCAVIATALAGIQPIIRRVIAPGRAHSATPQQR